MAYLKAMLKPILVPIPSRRASGAPRIMLTILVILGLAIGALHLGARRQSGWNRECEQRVSAGMHKDLEACKYFGPRHFFGDD